MYRNFVVFAHSYYLFYAPLFDLIIFKSIGIIRKGLSIVLDKLLSARWFWAEYVMKQHLTGSIAYKDSG